MVATLALVARAPVTDATWPRAERAQLESRLRALGTGITELSDAREALGLERLSDATPVQRAAAHHLVAGRKGRAAIEAVRTERESLTFALSRIEGRLVAMARTELGVRARVPARMRLGELRAVVAMVRAIHRDEVRAAARPV